MDVLTTTTVGLATTSALLSAIGAVAAWRSTKAMQNELQHTVAAKRYELIRSFEQDFSDQYDQVWTFLGPWPDEVVIDPELRRTVHSLLQTTACVFVARQSDLIDQDHADALLAIYFQWLRTDKASHVWNVAFRRQADTWPTGFVEFVDSRLDAGRTYPRAPSDGGAHAG